MKSARGSGRTYRVLEVALGHYIRQAFESIYECFARSPLGFPIKDRNLHHRSLAFRLLARCGSALHQLMRVVHTGHPYRIFLLLRKLGDDLQRIIDEPPCLRDEFSSDFLTRFRGQEDSEEATAILSTIAGAVDVDIATMEARHAVTRRATIQKSLQTWVASLENVNVTWSVRQCQRSRKKFGSVTKTEMTTKETNKVKKQQKKKSGGGGGGGAFRAFIHERFGGHRLSKENMPKIAQAYHALSPAEHQHFVHLGQLGTVAWRQNRGQRQAAFGKPLPKSSDHAAFPRVDVPEPTVLSTGVVAAPDLPGRQQPRSAVVATVACSFERGLKTVVSEQRSVSRLLSKQIAQEDQAMQLHAATVLAKSPDFMEGVSPTSFFDSATQVPLPASDSDINEVFVAPDSAAASVAAVA